ncbi:MAG: TIGR00730 family Rossman fold protein [Pseudomonadota bacterium]
MKSVCVFCGSKSGNEPGYVETARTVGGAIARRGLQLVYGGGGRGMMGAVADGAIAAGGRTLGVIPEGLFAREGLHPDLDRLEVVESMHARKGMMADNADAFIALPGGIGTMEELFEIWTWTQIGVHGKPCGILNVRGYYDALLVFLNSMVEAGFLDANHREAVLVDDDPDRLLDRVLAHRPAINERWLSRQQT